MDIILYEDEEVSLLEPITATRPAYDVRTAGLTLLESVKFAFPKARIFSEVRANMKSFSIVPEYSLEKNKSENCLFLNARLTPSLSKLLDVAGAPLSRGARRDVSWELFSHPEEIIFFNEKNLKENLQILSKKLKAKKKGLYLGKNVKLPKQFSYDVSAGHIVVGDNVKIHSFVALKGPLYIGNNCEIKEFTVIEGFTTIGPVCKIGGEIGTTIIDGYSNKQHTGSLGKSYVGRWVNIGGGTSISTLKNTYSNVFIDGRDSGSQLLGAILGDFSKTAVNTSVFPGKIIGVSSHLYGTVTEDVPAFTSHVQTGKLYELPLSIAEKIQSAMSKRRGVSFTESDKNLLKNIFEKTEKYREAKQVLKEKLNFK